MDLTLEELVSEIEAIYEPLLGKAFVGSIHERNTTAVCTGGPRDVVNVDDEDVCESMKTIVHEVEKVSKKFQPENAGEKVWKGITIDPYGNPPRLWVKSYEGGSTTTNFRVANIEVKTGLNWQRSYLAMVNITLD